MAEIVRRYGGLFISDEVQTGFGRTGSKWFGIEHWDVEPDIMTCAKGIANPSGNARGQVIDVEPMLLEYYALRGWDQEKGWPTPGKLRELGLEDAVERLGLEGKEPG